MAPEILLGRALAFGCHPFCAWRVLSRAGRVVLAAGYFGAAYVLTLVMLLTGR